MKKSESKNPEEAPPWLGKILFGFEHDGVLLAHLCAPQELLDYTSGGFEHKGDAYYNSLPKCIKGHKWKMLEPGRHVTVVLGDVEAALGDNDCRVVLTERCVQRLSDLGYTVRLLRTRTIEITQHLEVQLTRSNRYSGTIERTIKDTIDTKVWGVGNYKI